MADLSRRSGFVYNDIICKVLDEEAISFCSMRTKAELRTYLQNNRPAIWTLIQNHGTELEVTTCSRDALKNHYTIMLDRP